MTPQQLVAMAQDCATRWPDAVLEKNAVGNLVVVVGGELVAWLDLLHGEIDVFGVPA